MDTFAFAVDASLCTRCGLCVSDCPSRLISLESGQPSIAPELEERCIDCQHCLAVCPSGALAIRGFRPECSLPLSQEALPGLDQLDLLVRGRRSVRQYKDEDVDPALVQRLLDAVVHAPTGVNSRKLTYTVIDDRSVMDALRRRVMEALGEALESGRLEESAGRLAPMVEAWRDRGLDPVFRGAPHLLLISAPPDTPTPEQDVPLALAYFELLAQSAGLGTVWLGLLKRALQLLPELKPLVGLPADHVYYAMLFGLPAVRYARTVQHTGRVMRLRALA